MIWANQGWEARPVRTLFLSDVHLGCRHAQSDAVLAFLRGVSPQQVYLVGDFLDLWRLKRRWRWPKPYDAIVNHLLGWAEIGIPLYYTPGNHDDLFRAGGSYLRPLVHAGLLTIRDEFECALADGRRMGVLHGDQFDSLEQGARWLSVFNSFLYDQVLSLNWLISRGFRPSRRSPYWLCGWAKDLVKQSVRFMQRFEDKVFQHACERGFDGVICGHLHMPRIVFRDGLTYCNVGDWVENCTAVVESLDGQLELIRYYEQSSVLERGPDRTSEAAQLPGRSTTHFRRAERRAGLGAADRD